MKKIIGLPATTINYLRKVIAELRLVEWLSAGEVARNTFAVVFLTVLIGLFIVAADALFVRIREFLFSIG